MSIAGTDRLTGLPGRAAFHALVAAALHQRDASVGVILIDIDGFSGFNAVLRPDAGDKALVEFGQRLVREVGKQGSVARLDGDEFAVMMPGSTLTSLREMAQFCHAVMRQALPGSPLMLTASIGTALGPKDAATAWELINVAAVAQFVAKASGRDRVVAAKPLMRTQIERSVRDGIATGTFGLAFQPIVALQGPPRLAAVEGFLRWHHPTRGLIFPANFLPLLEDARLATMLAAAALAEAVAQARQWLDQRMPVGRIAINLSVHQLRSDAIVSEIEAALALRKVPPTMLAVELPADAYLLPDLAMLSLILGRVRGLGITVTVDSGQAGLFDLAALQRLPIDCVKLDRAFAKTLSPLELGKTIRAIHDADIVVAAEGVEMPDQLDRLAASGCDQAQGWGIGRPMPAAKLPAFIAKLDTETRAAA